MWIKGGMIDRRKKNKKNIVFPCVWPMNYIIKKGNVIKHQYNKILKKERIRNRNFTFDFRVTCLPLDTEHPESELNQTVPSSTP
jgi:hypothetical protein